MIKSIKNHHGRWNFYKCQLSWSYLKVNMIIIVLVFNCTNRCSVAKSIKQYGIQQHRRLPVEQ